MEVPRLPASRLRADDATVETSAAVRARVCAARARALERHGRANAEVPGPEIERHGRIEPPALRRLDDAIEALGLSARAWHRSLRLARTIADLAGRERVDDAHVAEAVALRALDRATAAATP